MSNSNNVVDNDNEINWSEVIKKEARGSNDADFGEVQEVVLHYVLTEKGILNKDKFYLPRALVEGFDGDKLRFNISEEEADEKFKRDEAPAAEEYDIFSRKKTLKTKNFEPKEADKQQDKQVVDKEFEERARQQAEEKAKMEAERKAQSIAQQIQDKAKMEAERKAQSIIQEARDKAKVEVDEVVKMEADQKANEIIEETEEKAKKEAEENSQSIIQQAEDRARQEADRRSKELIQQAEDRARQEAEDKITRTQQTTEKMILYTQEEIRNPEVNGYDANNPVFNPFITGITLWQNYSTIWMNISKQILGNTKRMARDFEDTMGKTWSKSRW